MYYIQEVNKFLETILAPLIFHQIVPVTFLHYPYLLCLHSQLSISSHSIITSVPIYISYGPLIGGITSISVT